MSGFWGSCSPATPYRSPSRLSTAYAEEAAHLFFGNALENSWSGLWDTHPPLPERMEQLELVTPATR